LTRNDIHLDTAAHVACRGKGRKHRITPLTNGTVAILRTWLTETPGADADPLFPTSRGGPLSLDALAQRVAVHAATATASCPSLASKHITPHVLRHTAAMRLLHAGVDTNVIALWLGHENVTTTKDLPASRPQTQTASTRPDRTHSHTPRPLPATRPATRLPRSPLRLCRQPLHRDPSHQRIHHQRRHNRDLGIMPVIPISE
jgi:integrase